MNRVNWMILSWLILGSTVRFVKGNSTSANTTPANLGPPPQTYNLWCLFCRSDKDTGCINKAIENSERLSQPCSDKTVKSFWEDLKQDPPDRPVLDPARIAGENNWVCYRMYTLDGTFALRTCAISRKGLEPREEECHHCTFDKVRAMCCTCSDQYCNEKNSDATRLVEDSIVIFILSVSVLLICAITSSS